MKIADMLNPTVISQLSSPPLSPQQEQAEYYNNKRQSNNGKPRSRFSNVEDAIICEGVARGLTWGQISGQLPHRKRATCFNRYRTLQGIRKSRKRSMPDMRSPPITPPNVWLPSPSKERHSYYHSNPVLVAPLPTRLPIPYSYSDRIH
ncbi:hypothetical protein MFLAVUS_007001 [Mucor flavus]|uniref:Myb-like domain-containing protein n=2 Tax=Mucoraceae TaxID=34489 RepID=A0A8H7SM44_9FUNG|nr:hypothetical protein INT48_004804 [Thamnidium elegans]